MTRYIAFLRGINMAGHNIIKMDSLKNTFETAGMKNIKTYGQSGNVVFDSRFKNIDTLTKKIENQLSTYYGREFKTMIRTVYEIECLIKQNPFKKKKNTGDAKFYVLFLHREIPGSISLPAVRKKDACEIIRKSPKEIFIVSYPLKSGRYGFPVNLTEKKLGTSYTGRNWNTICKIIEM